MSLEIEKKYLLTNHSWKEQANTGQRIKQGYLSTEPERTVRVRLIEEKAWLTIKGKTVGTTRLEFEYEIPAAEALQLLELCEKPLLEKTRYRIPQGQFVWEIDEFEGENAGLIVAEIELESENQPLPPLPQWIGDEVSHDPRYYNSNLIKHPFSKW